VPRLEKLEDILDLIPRTLFLFTGKNKGQILPLLIFRNSSSIFDDREVAALNNLARKYEAGLIYVAPISRTPHVLPCPRQSKAE
jgi:hypothetical protein